MTDRSWMGLLTESDEEEEEITPAKAADNFIERLKDDYFDYPTHYEYMKALSRWYKEIKKTNDLLGDMTPPGNLALSERVLAELKSFGWIDEVDEKDVVICELIEREIGNDD